MRNKSMIRDVGDVVRAVDMQADIVGMVKKYLNLYREVCNEFNGVKIPRRYTPFITGVNQNDLGNVFLNCELVHVVVTTREVDVDNRFDPENDPNSDCFNSSFGIRHEYLTENYKYMDVLKLTIPAGHLLMSQEDCKKMLRDKVDLAKKKEEEDLRIKKIAALEKQLLGLRGLK